MNAGRPFGVALGTARRPRSGRHSSSHLVKGDVHELPYRTYPNPAHHHRAAEYPQISLTNGSPTNDTEPAHPPLSSTARRGRKANGRVGGGGFTW